MRTTKTTTTKTPRMSLDIIIIYLYENKAKTQQNKLTNKKEPNNGLAL